jgi:hypothetical protein
MASEITEVLGTEYGREPAAATETKVIAKMTALHPPPGPAILTILRQPASAAQPIHFCARRPLPASVKNKTTNMVDAEDRFKAGTESKTVDDEGRR